MTEWRQVLRLVVEILSAIVIWRPLWHWPFFPFFSFYLVYPFACFFGCRFYSVLAGLYRSIEASLVHFSLFVCCARFGNVSFWLLSVVARRSCRLSTKDSFCPVLVSLTLFIHLCRLQFPTRFPKGLSIRPSTSRRPQTMLLITGDNTRIACWSFVSW